MTDTMSPNQTADDAGPPILGGSRASWAKAHHILLGFLALALVLWLLSGFYKVNTGEVAVVERLGSYIRAGGAEAGKAGAVVLMEARLHYHLPYPIDVVHKVPQQQTQTLTVDDFNTSPAEYMEMKKALLIKGKSKAIVDALYDPYLITGDKNLIHASLTLSYHVVDPEAYLTCVSAGGRDELIRQIANHVLIKELARWPVDTVLTGGAAEMQRSIQANVQAEVDQIALGIKVDQIQMAPPKPPDAVAGAFNDVIQAKQDQGGKELEGKTMKSSAVTRATAEAQSTLFKAQTEKQQQVLEAQGEASRFQSVVTRFQAAPDFTRASLFYDTMNQILGGAGRIIWVQPGQDTNYILDPPEARRPEEAPPVR